MIFYGVASRWRPALIRFDALFLIVLSVFGLFADLASYLGGIGPFGSTFEANPLAIGVVEAHGLALLAGIGALSATHVGRPAHINLMLIHLLLGSANLVFFDVFLNVDAFTMGVVITALHFTLAVAQAMGAWRQPRAPAASQVAGV